MHEAFREGFEKKARARWYKEYLKNPAKFVDYVTGNTLARSAGSSTGRIDTEVLKAVHAGEPMRARPGGGWGTYRKKGILGGEGPDNPIVHGGASDVAEALGLSETRHPHIEYPLTAAQGHTRRNYYEKLPSGEYIRNEPSTPKNPRMTPGTTPYRKVNSRRTLDIVHATNDADNVRRSPVTFTPSAVTKGLPRDHIYAVAASGEAAVDDMGLNATQKIYVKGVPERDVLYTGTLLGRHGPDRPEEILVPGRYFKERS